VLAPHVLAAVHEEAPAARVIVLPIDPADAVGHVESGALDLALAPIATVPTNVGAKELFEVGGLLAMRPDHPLARRSQTRAGGPARRSAGLPKHGLATLDDLTRHPQVMVSFVGSSKSQIDEALAREGKKRHVAFVLTSFLAVPHVLAETDALAILPSPFAKALEAKGLIATAPLPEGVAFPALRMRMLWPLAQDASPASRWLRELVARVAKRVVR
jgi:DNA-binding transcriptional LysR family regulator